MRLFFPPTSTALFTAERSHDDMFADWSDLRKEMMD